MIKDYIDYSINYSEGYYDAKNNNQSPFIDYSDINTLAKYDGYKSRKENKNVNFNDIENSYKLSERKIALFEKYKKGFLDGLQNAFLKKIKNKENYNVIPDIKNDDIYSIGFVDGYSYQILKEERESEYRELENNITISDTIELNNYFTAYLKTKKM